MLDFLIDLCKRAVSYLNREKERMDIEQLLATLRAQVEATKGVEASAAKLVRSIPDLIKNAIATSTNVIDLQNQLNAIADGLKVSADDLAAAVTANSPAPAPAPAPVPAPSPTPPPAPTPAPAPTPTTDTPPVGDGGSST